MMLNNHHFSWNAPLLLVAVGFFALSSHAQLPTKRISKVGVKTDARPARFAPADNNPRAAVKQTGINLTFGLVDFPRSPDSTALGLNTRGDIVGFYGPNVPLYEGTEQSYVLEGNNFQELTYPGAAYTGALGINKSRKIVGWYTNPGDNSHSFLRKGKTYTNIDYPGADNTTALNINDAGTIIGIWFNNADETVHGFVLTKGGYTTIDVPNALYTEPVGINSAGVIVGEYYGQDSVLHGFICQKGQFTTVDYPGASNTDLTGINDQGQMVGGYGDDIFVGEGEWSTPYPFLLDQGTFTPLTLPLDDAQVTWTYTLNGNSFVGMYVNSLGNIQGFEATISQ
jgi:uncharacterized membrane protein